MPFEPLLSPSTVQPGNFGKRYARTLDGNVYVQPLYLPGVTVRGKGVHNVVLTATAHNSVYAFDADSNAGANAEPLWQANFLDPAGGVTSVPSADVGCSVIAPEIGITGTPVVDPAALILYVIAETKEPGPSYVYRLHALDVTTGLEIEGSPVRIEPAGFNAAAQKQRTGLLLANGKVYSTWSGICDLGEYEGWVMAHDARTLEMKSAWHDSPDKRGGSFWNGGAGPAADAAGSLFVITANGPFNADAGGSSYGDSFLKLNPDLSVADYFAPFNREYLDANDIDLGSAGAVLLPEETGTAEHPHLLTSAGKEGRLYLIDRDRMGKAQTGSDAGAVDSQPAFTHSMFGSPAYFLGRVYVTPEYSPLMAIPVANAAFDSNSAVHAANGSGELGATPSISSNGATNGVVWIVPFTGGGVLEAYNAADLSRLYSSAADPADSLGGWSEFAVPTVADSKVFVGAGKQLVAYGVLNANAGQPAAITNAASFQAGTVAPGSLVSIFGSALAKATANARSQPLPISLADVSVKFNGEPAPLLYVSESQINAQLPSDVAVGTATLVVTVSGKPAPPFTVQVAAAAPGIFTDADSHAATVDATGQPVNLAHPATGGTVVSVFLTGMETLSQPVAATIGDAATTVQYAGPAPGYTGLSQVNIAVPNLPNGVYPLIVQLNGVASNTAKLAIGGR